MMAPMSPIVTIFVWLPIRSGVDQRVIKAMALSDAILCPPKDATEFSTVKMVPTKGVVEVVLHTCMSAKRETRAIVMPRDVMGLSIATTSATNSTVALVGPTEPNAALPHSPIATTHWVSAATECSIVPMARTSCRATATVTTKYFALRATAVMHLKSAVMVCPTVTTTPTKRTVLSTYVKQSAEAFSVATVDAFARFG